MILVIIQTYYTDPGSSTGYVVIVQHNAICADPPFAKVYGVDYDHAYSRAVKIVEAFAPCK